MSREQRRKRNAPHGAFFTPHAHIDLLDLGACARGLHKGRCTTGASPSHSGGEAATESEGKAAGAGATSEAAAAVPHAKSNEQRAVSKEQKSAASGGRVPTTWADGCQVSGTEKRAKGRSVGRAGG
jgi:hypothetical protein